MNIQEWLRLARNLFNREARQQGQPERTAKVIVVVTDRGDFGFHLCGSCHKVIPENPSPDFCPHCHTPLIGREVAPSTGGSDF